MAGNLTSLNLSLNVFLRTWGGGGKREGERGGGGKREGGRGGGGKREGGEVVERGREGGEVAERGFLVEGIQRNDLKINAPTDIVPYLENFSFLIDIGCPYC